MDLNPGLFEGFFKLRVRAFFNNFAHISGKKTDLIWTTTVKLFADDVKNYVVVDSDTKVAVLQEV